MRRMLAALAALAMAAVPARASTKRLAVVVGNNTGNLQRSSLHYAEADAEKFARVLGELGGVEPDDLVLLEGKSVAALGEAFARIRGRVARLRADPTVRIIVLFYFSGHSDGEALELGPDRLTFSELRRWLAGAGADVRVALVDSCKSGALLAAKGGKPGQEFQIRLTDELASTGEVLLTSSAADEIALESREIAGSFFTHHFVSGLRGAADASGDGLVTLTEAYQYAYAHTIKTTGETILGTQHPAYDYRLSGQGELVLAELSKRSATLALPSGFDRIMVIDLARDQVVAEVTSDSHATIAVQPGRYAIRASRQGAMFAGTVAVAAEGRREVRGDELAPATSATITRKGELAARAGGAWLISAGGTTGIAERLGVVPAVRVARVMHHGLVLAASAGSRAGGGFRESSVLVLAGYRRHWVRGGWSTWVGFEAGGGAVIQSVHPTAYSSVMAAGAAAGVALDLSRAVAIAVEATFDGELLKRNGRTALVASPAGWLGLMIRR